MKELYKIDILVYFAIELAGIDPKGFCKEVAVPDSYATEFTQMIALSRLMKEQGVRIV